MKRLALIVLGMLCLLPRAAHAHRLDEYLQATILSIDATAVQGSVRLVPGTAVAAAVIAGIDTDGDGAFSDAEQKLYALRVLNDLTLTVDGHALALRLVSASYPAVDQLRQGMGEILLRFTAPLTPANGMRTLRFENHHQPTISIYLVNCLVPDDPGVQLGQQVRNVNQSTYQLTFQQGGEPEHTPLLPGLSGLGGAFRLGVQHIAEGTDHLLFLLTLLLPAPLLAVAGRWRQTATVRRSLTQIVRIVTAFTVGHSLTLLLSAMGLVSLPSRPVEVLIAVSILVSAVHAMRPIFPGREAAIAAFFGLIHGLAFASVLSNLGFGHWYRLLTILGFNLGIEAMQLLVVLVTLPSLLLLSRTPVYRFFRIGGAVLAAVAAIAWILERAFTLNNPIGPAVETLAQHGAWIALSLFVFSVLCWSLQRRRLAPAFR